MLVYANCLPDKRWICNNGWFIQLLLFKRWGGTAVAVSKKISNSPPGIRTSALCELIWIMYCGYSCRATDRANSTWLSHQPRANTSYISQKLAGIYNWSEPKWISDWRQSPKREKKNSSQELLVAHSLRRFYHFQKSPKFDFAACKKEEKYIKKSCIYLWVILGFPKIKMTHTS